MAKSSGGSLLSSIQLDKQATDSLQHQLYTALRDMILNGSLRGGERLPASRVLAQELAISRTTVIGVFDRLTSEALLESRTGSGSFVMDVFSEQKKLLNSLQQNPPETQQTARQRPAVASSFMNKARQLPSPVIHSVSQSFSTAIPAIDAFPLSLWARLVSRHSRLPGMTRYNSSKGSLALRQAIAAHLHTDRGLICDAEQVYITSGAHQAFSFLAQLLIDPGDKVWIENPGSRVARNGLLQTAPELIPVPVDDEGLDVAAGLQQAPNFRLATVTPSHQQPRGVLLSLARRLALLEAADQVNGWIIEDDYDGELFYNKEPLPTLFSLSQQQRVIHVGTFSKTIFPALRMGYFVVPAHLVEEIDKVINSFLPAVPLPLQAAVAEFIGNGHFATHIRRSKKLYEERYQALSAAVDLHLADYLAPVPTATGFHMLSLFRQPMDEAQLTASAAAMGLLVRPLANYCATPIEETGIAMGFGCIQPDDLFSSCQLLARAFQQLE